MKTFIKLLLLVGIVFYLGFAAVKFLARSESHRCEGLSVRVNAPEGAAVVVDSASVARLLASKGIVPDSMLIGDIDLMLVDSILEADPYIHEAQTYKSSMNRLCVDVTIVQPMAHVMAADGEYYIDSHGKVIPAGGRFLDVPIITGHPDRRWAGRYLPRVVEAIAADSYWRDQVEQIHVAADSTVTLVPRKGDMLLHLGRAVEIPDKLDRLRLFYEEALPRVGWNKYTDINCEYAGQLICTRKNKHKK